MYDDLVERLRYCAVSDNQCLECKYRGGSPDGSKMCIDLLMVDAADAIEELTGFVQEAERDRDEYRERLDKANDAIEVLSKPQNIVHLCTSCKYQYPECPADTGVVFGSGKGNDNICQCADYVARYPRWIPVTEEQDG